RPSNRDPTTNSLGEGPGESESKFHTCAGVGGSAARREGPDINRTQMENAAVLTIAMSLHPNRDAQRYRRVESSWCSVLSSGPKDRFPYRPDPFLHRVKRASPDSVPRGFSGHGTVPSP